MDGRPWCLWMAAAMAATAVATGCARRGAMEPESESPEVAAEDPPATAPITPMPPSPSPRLYPVAATRPAPATRPATAPVASTQPAPATRPVGNFDEIRSVRGQFTETFEQLDLFRREIAELHLEADERREVKGLFDRAASAWAQAEAELEAGRMPSAGQRTALAGLARDTESKVKTVLGSERAIQLAAYRQTARGGGQRFVSRLRVALKSLYGERNDLTPEQSPGLQSLLEHLRRSVDKLPAQDAATFEEEQAVRQRIQAVIDETRARLGAVLTPAQMAHVTRQVPSLAKPGAATRPAGR